MKIVKCDWEIKKPINTIKLLTEMPGNGQAYIVENGTPEGLGWECINKWEIHQRCSINSDIFYSVGRGQRAAIYSRSSNTSEHKSITRGVGKISGSPTSDVNNHLTTQKPTFEPMKLTEAHNVKELIDKVRSNGDLKRQILEHKIHGMILDYLSENQ